MKSAAPWPGFDTRSGLLIDANLLVLFVVGTVNLGRIEDFKRTRKYNKGDYQLLLRVMERLKPWYTLAHVMAEVSKPERPVRARTASSAAGAQGDTGRSPGACHG